MITIHHEQENDQVTTAILLAAGMGTRFRDMVSDRPKGFMEMNAFPIIERSVRQLQSVGIRDIIIVTGFESVFYQEMAKRFDRIRIVHNRNYARSGSMYSFYCARKLLSSSFLLLESDIVYETRALEMLLATHKPNAILLSGPTSAGDEVWVETRGNRVLNISKNIAVFNKGTGAFKNITGELVGISKISPRLFKMIMEYAESYFRQFDMHLDYEDCINNITGQMDVFFYKIDDLLWGEIDVKSQFVRVQSEVLPKILQKETESNDNVLEREGFSCSS